MSHELYKTKLCKLYQRGICHRHACSFAHGQKELRSAPSGVQRDSGAHRDDYDSRRSHSEEDRHRYHRQEDRHSREERRRYSPGQRAREFERRQSEPGHQVQSRKSPSKYHTSPRSNGQKVSNIEGETKKGNELSEVRREDDYKEASDSLMREIQKAKEDVQKLDKRDKQMQATLQSAREEITTLKARVAELEAQEDRARKRCQQLEQAFTHYMRCKKNMERATAMMQELMSQPDEEYPHESFEPLPEDDTNKRKTPNGDIHEPSKRQKCESEEKIQFSDDEASE